ncbi:MAG: hypothetical protein IPM57_12610 [Oligoflexia bacterium]|nr:hypothetical protein [Oligoflexia bacterium]
MGLALARQHNILPLEQAQSLRYLGQIATMHGDYAAARTYYQASLTLAQQIGSRPHEGRLLKDLGIIGGGMAHMAVPKSICRPVWLMCAPLATARQRRIF